MDDLSQYIQTADQTRKMIAVVSQKPPAMDTAEKLHASLTDAFAVLHKIARLPCHTDPEGVAEFEAHYGYRKPCKSDECSSCLAWWTLIREGRLPLFS